MVLPQFTGGVRSKEQYNAGVGLGDNRVIELPEKVPYFKDGMQCTEPEFRAYLTKLNAEGIRYMMQYGIGGVPSLRMEYNQRVIDVTWMNGTVSVRFVDEYMPKIQTPVIVTTYTSVTRDEYTAYIRTLKEQFSEVFENEIDGNLFAEFAVGEILYRVDFMNGVVRISEDTVSVTLKEMSDDAPLGCTDVYQYGLHYTYNRGGFAIDCGMCYVLKLPDNSLFMIDGGYYSQCTTEATEGLMDLLRHLSGNQGKKIRLSWFGTHAHDDHMDMLSKILRLHHEEILLERMFFNYADFSTFAPSRTVYCMMNRVLKYFPEVKYRKVHTGDYFTVGGCPMEILMTHEVSTGVNGNEIIGEINNASSVLKIHMDPEVHNGTTDFLITGDINTPAETILLSLYSHKTLHCGMVQAAHHLFNHLENLYDSVNADFGLVPSEVASKVNHNRFKYQAMARTIPENHFYFASEGTDGFSIQNHQIAHVFHQPLKGGVYDGSLL